ncbi:MAG: hypothetical protein AB7S57_20255 [Acetobacteraceae bacterium]
MSTLTVLSSEDLDLVAGGWGGSYTSNWKSNNNYNSNNNYQTAWGVNVILGGVSSGNAYWNSSSGNTIVTGSNS